MLVILSYKRYLPPAVCFDDLFGFPLPLAYNNKIMIACRTDKSLEKTPPRTSSPLDNAASDNSDTALHNSSRRSAHDLSEFISNLNRVGLSDREPDPTEAEVLSRKAEQSRLKYRRLKQTLQGMSYRHEELSLGREVPSNNKPRLMKLAIELEKQVHNQLKDYSLIDKTLRELFKIV